ncbi:polyribonucleotide nucleotidyltransferase [Brevibacillus ruminantium]|uniref:Polyribonucleotide nucleotidyltransferase n=1 Tax=Brevibacillus ruminantium TaxID=2950604 RepID=A0ABY4WEN2_9BACL|nr:polyribonucleotide nucleotidyltransferase [Brevibacillus ruminantium]USG65311.1 polyribonucleotide nucleotidyltransferase [Brevibacillus ruminantium]
MDLNSIMGAQLSQLQHTVSLSMMKMVQATQTASATVMLQDFVQAQQGVQQAAQAAPHPTAGNVIDVSV